MLAFSRWLPLVALLSIACFYAPNHLHSQTWEEVYVEDFAGVTNLSSVPDFSQAGAVLSPFGASGQYSDNCAGTVLNNALHYMAFELDFSTGYEYYVSFNAKKSHGFSKQIEVIHSNAPPAFNQPPTGTLIGNAITITQTGAGLPGQVIDSDLFSGLSGTHYIIFRKPAAASNNPVFTKIYFDDFKLYRRATGGPPNPVVELLTTSQSTNEGQTFSNDLTIDVIPTEAVSVQVDLTYASNSHFSNFTPQTITFPVSQSGNQSFDLTPTSVPGLPTGVYTYVFSVAAVGTNVDIGTNDELTVQVSVVQASCGFSFTSSITNMQCDNNFTAADGSDDTYTFDFLLTRSDGQSGTWSGFLGQQTITGTYGTASTLGPFNISDGVQAINVTDPIETICTYSTSVTPPAPCSTGNGADAINFTQSLQTIVEGETAGICVQLLPNNTFTEAIFVDIELVGDNEPYFSNYETETITIPAGSTAPICISIPSRVETAIREEVLSYQFSITNPRSDDATPIVLGGNTSHTVRVVDASLPQLLYPGDLAFIGFDNFVSNESDRIILTNMVPLSPGTRFSIANGNYCDTTDDWYEQGGSDPLAISQEITYGGSDELPVGSIICLDLPGGGTGNQLLAANFQIDGNTTDAFTVENNGNSSNPNLNLNSNEANNLYLISGDWVFDDTQTTLLGRSIALLQLGNTDAWLATHCTGGSNIPEDLDCVQGPDFPAGGSSYGYFDCSQFGTTLSRFDYLMYAADPINWTTGTGTAALDLPSTACDPACSITTDSLYWMTPPETLLIECSTGGIGALDNWLLTYGNGVPVTTCPDGTITVFNNYTPLIGPENVCDGDTLEVIFTAVDECGNFAECVGLYVIQGDERPLDILTQPSSLSINCTDIATVNQAYMDWIADWGGMEIEYNCGFEPICGVVGNAVPIINCDSQEDVIFFAVGLCNDTVFSDPVKFSIIDLVAPVITSVPAPLTVNCNDSGHSRHIDQWIANGGNAEAEDNCIPSITWVTSGIPAGFTCGTVTIDFQAQDHCGNLSTVVSTTLTITDDLPPVIPTLPFDWTFSADDPDLNDHFADWLTAAHIGVNDGCSEVTWTHDYDTSQPLPICQETAVVFTASDFCSNSSQVTTYFTVIEDEAPVITNAPQDLVVNCTAPDFDTQVDNWLDAYGYMTVTDNSTSNPTLSYDISSTNLEQVCGSYEVTFYASDDCGNLTSADAHIIVEDDSDLSAEYIASGQEITLVMGDPNFNSDLSNWLNSGGLRPELTDACYSEFTWTHDFYDQVDLDNFGDDCLTISVNFTLETGCMTYVLPPLNITINLDGLRQKDPGYDLSLACQCDAGSNTVLTDWLNNDGGIVFENCVDSTPITITHSTPDTDDLANCDNQTITFTITQGSTSYTIERQIIMSDPVCSPLVADMGYDIEVPCGNPDSGPVADWLDNHAGIVLTDACGSVDWTYTALDNNDITDCFDQTITFTGTDACGNVVTVQRQILMICGLSLSIQDNGTQLCAQVDGLCDGSMTYSWSDGQTGQCITPASDQIVTYTVTVSCSMADGNGVPVCTDLVSESYTHYPDCPDDYGVIITYLNSINLLQAQVSGCAGSPVYQWSLDGQPIAGATDQDYSPSLMGTYTFTVQNCTSCATASADYFWCPDVNASISPACDGADYDIVFLLDNSGSISTPEFDDMQASVLNTVADIESRIGAPDQVRYALASYNEHDPSNGSLIGTNWITPWQSNALSAFSRPPITCASLRNATEALYNDLSNLYAPRSNAELHIVLYTDAPADDYCSNLTQTPYVDDLKNDFGAIFSVVRYNTGDTIADNQANTLCAAIASSPDQFFIANSFDEPVLPIAENIISCTQLTAVSDTECNAPTFHWTAEFGGSIIGNNTTQTVNINGDGKYTVVVTCDDGCTGTAIFPEEIYGLQGTFTTTEAIHRYYMNNPYGGDDEEEFTTSTTAAELPSGTSTYLYPNPTNGEVFIDIQSHQSEDCQIFFRDVRGRQVHWQQERLQTGRNKYSFDTEPLPSGVYLVSIHTGEDIFHHKLVVE